MADQELKPIHSEGAGEQAWETAKSMPPQQTEPKSSHVKPPADMADKDLTQSDEAQTSSTTDADTTQSDTTTDTTTTNAGTTDDQSGSAYRQ